MKNFSIWKCAFLMIIVLQFAAVSPGHAMDDDIFMLEEVTVTAEKRSVNVQDTAVSITAITGANIRDRALDSLDSILGSVPGVQIQGHSQGRQVYIRGVGSNVDAQTADPSVAIMLDNVYASRTETPLADVYDVDRIEVLRGPQGTLYGRNAAGGTVNLVTNAPKIDQFESKINARFGDYNLKHFDGALNTPIGEKFAARFAFLRQTRDGYLSDGTMDSNKFGARAKLLFNPTEAFSILGVFDYSLDKSYSTNTVPVPSSAGNLADMPWNDDVGTEGWALPDLHDDWTTDEYHYGESRLETYTYSAEIDVDLGWSLLTAIPSYSDNSRFTLGEFMMGTAMGDGTLSGSENIYQQWAGEIRLASPDSSDIKWIIGYYMQDSDYNRDDTTDELTDYDDSEWHYATYQNPTGTHALFAQATYPVTEIISLTAGIRHSIDKQEMDYRYVNMNIPEDDSLYAYRDENGAYDSGIIHFENDEGSTTYKFGIEYTGFEDSMLYAQISTGFKQGGLNQTAPPSTFDPEELFTYEIGSKSRFFDNRLQVNAEIFYYDYDNYQVQCFNMTSVADTGDVTGTQMVLNAETGRNMGLDAEIDFVLTDKDRITASLSLLDAEYGDIVIPASTMGPSEDQDLSGTRMANAPEWSGSIGYQHLWHLDNGGEVLANINMKFSDGYFVTIEKYLAGSYQDSYHRTDLNVNYSPAVSNWSLGVWCKNIENDAQTTLVLPFYRRIITEPRTVGVSISLKY